MNRRIAETFAAAVLTLVAGCGGHGTNVPSGVKDTSITLDPTKVTPAITRSWLVNWGKVRVGMTVPEAVKVMGPPTNLEPFEEADWKAIELNFVAILQTNGRIQVLNARTDNMSERDKAAMNYPAVRTS